MKKATLTSLIIFAFCALSYAGESYSGKEMKQVEPMPPACPNWTGFYLGGFGGYKFASTDTDFTATGAYFGPDPIDIADKAVLEEKAPDNLDTSGAEVGGVIGYNHQWNKWVFGLEASGGYVWLDESHSTGTFTVPATQDVYVVSTWFESHYLVTAGPRIGYAFCKWLPYVTGGVAIGDIEFHQDQHQTFNVLYDEGGTISETKVGWMVGGGLQYAISDHWSVRAQYQYIDLGCVDFTGIGSAPNEEFTGYHEACLREHNASFAIIYGF